MQLLPLIFLGFLCQKMWSLNGLTNEEVVDGRSSLFVFAVANFHFTTAGRYYLRMFLWLLKIFAKTQNINFLGGARAADER